MITTIGVGFTVTVIVEAVPTHEPAVDVGITIYCTLPATVWLGLVKNWLIVTSEPAIGSVIFPTIVPTVHTKLLGVLAVRDILVLVPLQILNAKEFVIAGLGLTITEIINGAPVHEVATETGVIIYCTVPVAEMLELVRV